MQNLSFGRELLKMARPRTHSKNEKVHAHKQKPKRALLTPTRHARVMLRFQICIAALVGAASNPTLDEQLNRLRDTVLSLER